jgi:hypothetical protein
VVVVRAATTDESLLRRWLHGDVVGYVVGVDHSLGGLRSANVGAQIGRDVDDLDLHAPGSECVRQPSTSTGVRGGRLIGEDEHQLAFGEFMPDRDELEVSIATFFC